MHLVGVYFKNISRCTVLWMSTHTTYTHTHTYTYTRAAARLYLRRLAGIRVYRVWTFQYHNTVNVCLSTWCILEYKDFISVRATDTWIGVLDLHSFVPADSLRCRKHVAVWYLSRTVFCDFYFIVFYCVHSLDDMVNTQNIFNGLTAVHPTPFQKETFKVSTTTTSACFVAVLLFAS